MSNATVLSLPNEIIDNILWNLETDALLNICYSCKRLYILAKKHIHREITLCPLRTRSLLSFISNIESLSLNPFLFIRHLTFEPSGPTKPACFHFGGTRRGYFHSDIGLILGLLHHLKTLRWTHRSCLPHAILDLSYSARPVVSGVETLIIKGNPNCTTSTLGVIRKDEISFSKLRRLSWTGIRNENEIRRLATFLKDSSSTLSAFESDFDFPSFSLAVEGYTTADPFFLLEIHKDDKKCIFPVLEELSLCSFPRSFEQLLYLHAFNFSSLRRLKLQQTEDTARLFGNILEADIPIRLKEFEYGFGRKYINIDDSGIKTSLWKFLASFEGLEKLYIAVQNSQWNICSLMQGIARHRTSLQELAFLDDDTPVVYNNSRLFALLLLSCSVDLKCLKILASLVLKRTSHLPEIAASQSKLRVLHLEIPFLNRQFASSIMQSLTLLVQNPQLRWKQRSILHNQGYYPILSLSIDRIICFVRWAFGPDGFRSLEFLTIGNLSFSSKRLETMLVFRRPKDVVVIGKEWTTVAVYPSVAAFQELSDDQQTLERLSRYTGFWKCLSAGEAGSFCD
ncbi:hypothetical protein LOZ61_002735 [Ophidiomyces ophidiicola]|nr:hypothetical protein LOZ61_002735 [Ophidiomyces ophidiicola]KAI1930319.1 hypothetical protein LOZ60_001102 [Ophidiomyces ophidiicola]KAI1968069.1 hypothetical protein LOZ59_000430 [Ophidiomyces ophidiicola]KAI1975628.1 hypothetical protein LOZ56_000536 [Ophidiomyces ophidiicola]KAI2012153.1 hypothetical protein LOZ49_002858 [Ophidiomyces ophidiicola]